MLNTLRAPLALGAVFFAVALSLTACGDDVPQSDVFKVQDTTVSKDTFNRWMTIAASSAAGQTGQAPASIVVPDPPDFEKCIADKKKTAPEPVKGQPKPTDAQFKQQCQQQYTQLKDQVMTFLIRAEWLEAEADRLGIDVSDEQVKKEFDKARKQAFPKTKDYEQFLKTSGQTEADLLFRQRTQLLEQKITEKVQKGEDEVTDADIKAYYEKNKAKQFSQPQARDLKVVLTDDEAKAKAAKKALEDGDSWESVVKKYSTDPTSKDSGGVLPNVQKGQGEKAFDEAVFGAEKGELVGPVKTTDGFYVFEVTKDTPAKVQPLDNQLKDTIKQIIVSENQRKALTTFGKEYQERWREETTCQKGYVVPDCGNAKKQATSTVPPGAVPQEQGGGQQQPQPQPQPQPQG